LLKGECTKTDFTLVDAGSTVYFAGFNGCNGERPECCPWQVATTSAPATTAGGTNQDTGNHLGFDFPQPQDSNQAVLAACADDYYSISGGCCPVYVNKPLNFSCSSDIFPAGIGSSQQRLVVKLLATVR